MKPFDIDAYHSKCAIEDAAHFFARLALGYVQEYKRDEQIDCQRAILEAAITEVGAPVIVTETPKGKSRKNAGMIYLVFRWRDDVTRRLAYPEIAEAACRWWNEYSQQRLSA